MQIYNLLKNDHQTVRGILSELSDTSEKGLSHRSEFLARLKCTLTPQSRAKEIVLYDRMKLLKREDATHRAFESYEEHRLCDLLISELADVEPTDPRWRAKFEVLREILSRHISKEEQVLFEQAKAYFSTDEAEAMAKQYEELKIRFSKTLPQVGEVLGQDEKEWEPIPLNTLPPQENPAYQS